MNRFTRLAGFITFLYCLASCEMAVAQDGEPEQETIRNRQRKMDRRAPLGVGDIFSSRFRVDNRARISIRGIAAAHFGKGRFQTAPSCGDPRPVHQRADRGTGHHESDLHERFGRCLG